MADTEPTEDGQRNTSATLTVIARPASATLVVPAMVADLGEAAIPSARNSRAASSKGESITPAAMRMLFEIAANLRMAPENVPYVPLKRGFRNSCFEDVVLDDLAGEVRERHDELQRISDLLFRGPRESAQAVTNFN